MERVIVPPVARGPGPAHPTRAGPGPCSLGGIPRRLAAGDPRRYQLVMPALITSRPGDVGETVEAWTVVLTDGHTPWPGLPPKGMRVVVALLGDAAPDAPVWARTVRVPTASAR